MADNKAVRGGQDARRINVNQEHEVRYWTEALSVSADELKKAVAAVGDRADDVRRHLKREGSEASGSGGR